MTIQFWTPYATSTLNGVAIDTQLLKGARVEASLDDPVSKGYIKCTADPGGWVHGDEVTVTLGGGINNLTRLPTATILQADYLNTGPDFEFVCRGPLYWAQRFKNNRPNGYTIYDLTGGPAPDEEIVRAVLDIVGVPYNPANISGTGIVRGASAPDGYTWRKGESALDYIGRIDKASIGYKLVETIGTDIGQVFRVQVLGTPAGPADHVLEEGIDIFEGGHTQVEAFDTFDAWEVTGFDYGDGLGPVYNRDPDPIPNGAVPYAFSSEMIERGPDSDTRSGISCETVKNYLRGQTQYPITKISGIVTPRDDLFGPGAIVQLIAPTTLGVNGFFWITSVTAECDSDWFLHTLGLVG